MIKELNLTIDACCLLNFLSVPSSSTKELDYLKPFLFSIY